MLLCALVCTENAWVMTRERIAPTAVMQSAYGVLDKYRISRAFFVRTNQADCNILPDVIEPIESKSAAVDAVVAKDAIVNEVPEKVVPELPLEVRIRDPIFASFFSVSLDM